MYGLVCSCIHYYTSPNIQITQKSSYFLQHNQTVLHFFSFIANGQNITGKWNSKLYLLGHVLTIVFNVNQSANGLDATMVNLNQKVFDQPAAINCVSNTYYLYL